MRVSLTRGQTTLLAKPLVARPPRCESWREWPLARLKTARKRRKPDIKDIPSRHVSTRCWPTDCARRGSKLSEVAWRRMRMSGEWGKYLESCPVSIVSIKNKRGSSVRHERSTVSQRLFNFPEGLVPNSEKLYRVVSRFHALPRIVLQAVVLL